MSLPDLLDRILHLIQARIRRRQLSFPTSDQNPIRFSLPATLHLSIYGHHTPRNSTDLGPEIRPSSPVHPDLLYRLPPSYRIIPILLAILLISPRGRISPLLDLRCRVGVGAHTGDGGVGLLGGIRVPLRLLGYGRRVSGGRVGRVREVVGGVRLTLLGVFRGGFVIGFVYEEVVWIVGGRRCRRLYEGDIHIRPDRFERDPTSQ